MLKKTKWSVAVATLASVGLVSACSGGNEAAGGEAGGEVTVWMTTQEDTQKAAWDELVSTFEEQNPDITIKTEARAIDAHKDALRQVAGTNSGPDIYWYWEGAGLGGELVDVGMSKDLTEYYEQYGWDDRFTSAALSSVTQYGGYHGVPWTQQAQAIFYNKKLFEQAGITELPTTYDDLVKTAETLKGAGITPMEFGGTVNWHVMRLLDSLIETKCGADKADELNTGDGDWGTEPCVTEAFTELKTWADNYLNEGFMAISNDDSSQLFFTGEAAMTIEGTWFESNAIDGGMSPEDIGIFAFPTGTERLYGFGEGFYINAESDQPDEAAKFLDFITSTEGQEIAGNAWAALSVNKDVKPSGDSVLAPTWNELFANAEGIYTNNDQNFSTAETTEYWRVQNSVLTGDLAPADAGAEFQAFRDANQ
ncbi:ABC transporter substrate-binding protein [Puerhibacterium puerhi]|uniref:ABC transporter substrate-binding protein n=1 Tax=Puerhibacterium puerhi TaxID=2692623 RepID=UPI001F480920|nr:extracellular solute-binding protein [Puerhibacterium puerhi]